MEVVESNRFFFIDSQSTLAQRVILARINGNGRSVSHGSYHFGRSRRNVGIDDLLSILDDDRAKFHLAVRHVSIKRGGCRQDERARNRTRITKVQHRITKQAIALFQIDFLSKREQNTVNEYLDVKIADKKNIGERRR